MGSATLTVSTTLDSPVVVISGWWWVVGGGWWVAGGVWAFVVDCRAAWGCSVGLMSGRGSRVDEESPHYPIHTHRTHYFTLFYFILLLFLEAMMWVCKGKGKGK